MKTVVTLLILFTLFSLNTFAEYKPYTQFNLLEGAKARLGKGRITDMAYSPDGNRLAVATPIGIWIYDAETGETLNMLLGHTSGVTSVMFSPDGHTLASGSEDATVRLWDANTGSTLHTLTEHRSSVYSVAFSPDGRTLASAGFYQLYLWDAVSGQQKAAFTAHAPGVTRVMFSPDGHTLASGSWDGAIRLWDAASGAHKTTLTGHLGKVLSLAFSPDGGTLASGGANIRLWDTASGAHKITLTGDMNGVLSLAFSPDGRTLASGSGYGDGAIRLWDAISGQQKETLTGHTNEVTSVEFSPDGRTLASGGADGAIRLWDGASGAHKITLIEHMGGILSLAFSSDGRTLASGSWDGAIRLWDGVSGAHKTTLTGHEREVTSVAFSPDGRTLASGSGDATIRLWDASTGHYRQTLIGHTDQVTSIAFSPDGDTLASGSGDATIRLWDASTGQHRQTLTGHTDQVTSIAFSPDGDTLASGSGDATIRLWDASTGQHRQTLTGHSERINSVAFSPDGETLASGGYEQIWFWDVDTGKHKTGMSGFMNPIKIAFSPDGGTLASESKQGQQVRLSDGATGALKAIFPWHTHYFISFVFSPDGGTLASGTRDGFIFLWKLTPAILQQPQRTPSTLQQPQPNLPSTTVRLIYFYPKDSTPSPNINTELDTLVKETQQFYAEQMENHGFGRKTFTFETDANGNAVVHHVKGVLSAVDYTNPREISKELEEWVDIVNSSYLVVLDVSIKSTGLCGQATYYYGGSRLEGGGLAVIWGSGGCSNVGVAAHEVGHIARLAHDFRDDTYIMAYGTHQQLSRSAAEWLDVHPFFNPGQRPSNIPTKIEILSPRASRLRFQVTDADGLHQARLILTERKANFPCGVRETLHSYKTLNGNTSSTFEFVATEASTDAQLQVIDVHGNIIRKDFWINPDVVGPSYVAGDVNRDGVVDISDLVQVASSFGQTGQTDADVNGDNVVNIADLVLIAGVLDNSAAAPSLYPHCLEMLTAADVQLWLTQARYLNLTGVVSQRGIRFLEQFLAALTPKETALLANYPNPFNPETWIPYQLATEAAVKLHIYSVNGTLVRTLALGHQDVGIYQTRGRAAYWDGKNEFGEPVVSGIYFYQLSAGDYSATRKMVILK